MNFSKKSNKYYNAIGMITGIAPMYVKSISNMTLITREQEIELAKSIADSKKDVVYHLFTIIFVIEDFLKKFSQISDTVILAKTLFDLNKYIKMADDHEAEQTRITVEQKDVDKNTEETDTGSGPIVVSEIDEGYISDADTADENIETISPDDPDMQKHRKSKRQKKSKKTAKSGARPTESEKSDEDYESEEGEKELQEELDEDYEFDAEITRSGSVPEAEKSDISSPTDTDSHEVKPKKKTQKKNIFNNIRNTIQYRIKQHIDLVKEKVEAYHYAPESRKIHYLQEIGEIFKNNIILSDTAITAAMDLLKQKIDEGEKNEHILKTNEIIQIKYKVITDSYKKLLSANLRLVISVAKKYASARIDFMDIIQEANLGLLKAISKFEYEKGFKLSTYSSWWMRQRATQYLNDFFESIRLPAHSKQALANMNQDDSERKDQDLDNSSSTRMRKLARIYKNNLNMTVSTGADDDSDGFDFYEDNHKTYNALSYVTALYKKKLVDKVLKKSLDEREHKVFCLRFMERSEDNTQLTLAIIGYIFILTRERIRQVLLRAIVKIYNSPIAYKYRTNMLST